MAQARKECAAGRTATPARGLLLVLASVSLMAGSADTLVTEIIDGNGAGGANPLNQPSGIAVDTSGNVYITGYDSDNVFKITATGVISVVIDATGDGVGNGLDGPYDVAVDRLGNVLVTGQLSDDAFRISSTGVVTEVIDATGDGVNPLNEPYGIATDLGGNIYLTGFQSDNVFEITPLGVITQLIDSSGDGFGNLLANPGAVARTKGRTSTWLVSSATTPSRYPPSDLSQESSTAQGLAERIP